MKRIALFIATNLAVMVVIGLITSVFGLNRYIGPNGINVGTLMMYSLVVGFAGAIISLLMSKTVAKSSMGVKIIETSQNADEAWIVETKIGRAHV